MEDYNSYSVYLTGPAEDLYVAVPLSTVDLWILYKMGLAAISAVYISVPVIISLILFLIVGAPASPQFWLYQANCLFAVLKGAFLLASVEATSQNLVSIMTASSTVERTSTEVNVIICGLVFSLLLTMSLLGSLLSQILVAYSDLRRQKYWAVVIVSILSVMPCVIIWIWYAVVQALAAVDSEKYIYTDLWLKRAIWPVFAATVSFCSIVLSVRLWQVSRIRAKMGLQRFNALHIITITALQNSTIPALIAIITAAAYEIVPTELESLVLFFTTVFMPLGFIWAKIRCLTTKAKSSKNMRKLSRSYGAGGTISTGDTADSVSYREDKLSHVQFTPCSAPSQQSIRSEALSV